MISDFVVELNGFLCLPDKKSGVMYEVKMHGYFNTDVLMKQVQNKILILFTHTCTFYL